MNILITGGAGFIGSHTTDRFVKAGHQVRILDDFSSGKRSNLAKVQNEVEVMEADIRDADAVTKACRDIEIILHLAAVSSVAESLNNPLRTHQINATGTLNILQAAREGGARRVIFASSAAVYGDGPELPKREDTPTRPLSPYAWQKLTGEFYGRHYAAAGGFEFSSLRYFNVYGPRQDPGSPYSGVLSIFLTRAAHGEPLTVFGDGLQTRDFIHVSDVVEVNLGATHSSEPLPGKMNVATGIETSINEVAAIMQQCFDVGISHRPARPGDIHNSCADISLLRGSLDFTPEVEIRSGLRQLAECHPTDRPGI